MLSNTSEKSETLRTPTNACLLPALTTCSTVMVVILVWCQNRQIPRLSLTQLFPSLQHSYIVLVCYITTARRSLYKKRTQT
jgi:hypothetical protein